MMCMSFLLGVCRSCSVADLTPGYSSKDDWLLIKQLKTKLDIV